MGFTLRIDNYRALRQVRMDVPTGVCALVGPNASGKTSLLECPQFLRRAYDRDFATAVAHDGGVFGLRNFQAAGSDPEAPVQLCLAVQGLSWAVQLAIVGANVDPRCGELVLSGSRKLLEREPFTDACTIFDRPVNRDGRPALLRAAVEAIDAPPEVEQLAPLVNWLRGYRSYGRYDIDRLRRSGSPQVDDLDLHRTGLNVFSVLQTWHSGSRDQRARYAFVLDGMRAAFPGSVEDLALKPSGRTITADFLLPQADAVLPHSLASQGWLVMLLHLCAIASAPRGGAVSIDEPENGLHPFAIRRLMESAEHWAQANNVSILMATHSPALLDELRAHPERIFAMQPGQAVLPCSLDKMRNPAWLANFSIGQLYMTDDFGAPEP